MPNEVLGRPAVYSVFHETPYKHLSTTSSSHAEAFANQHKAPILYFSKNIAPALTFSLSQSTLVVFGTHQRQYPTCLKG
ncbi:MAG: hypothetical protein QXQ70_09975 [Candidatus Caldarchaeum sp.]